MHLEVSMLYSDSSSSSAHLNSAPLTVQGKFFSRASQKVYLRGVTYGPLGAAGQEYGDRQRVEADLEAMRRNHVNTLRTYTLPPRWLLDLAHRQGLLVLLGIPWEQHVAFLDTYSMRRAIRRRVVAAVEEWADHPAVMGFTLGNEIPASIVRWHGAGRVEAFLYRLYRLAKRAAPHTLLTYVNYPTTEYLQLNFLDFAAFNLYLERQEDLQSYLPRLQNLAGHLPFVMAEVGLDSRRNGLKTQASALQWQLRSIYESGAAGAFVFSWTDRWHRGGEEILDWEFGLTDRQGCPKPALQSVAEFFGEAPFGARRWPSFSVLVCVYNGARTIRQCIRTVLELDYPDFELVVVDDGSDDQTPRILQVLAEEVGESRFRVFRTPNRGLSAARNLGMEEARGEYLAYLDADAYPDPQWLRYLAIDFTRNGRAALGGPNVPPPEDGFISQCVAQAPGAPTHILLSDEEAEHVPGCNMAFRKRALQAIGGFDVRFRVAGDDVDVCWRLQEEGWSIGFSPAALVWHHYRSGLRAYWRQQRGYGRAETLLEQKWPEKYNDLGQIIWDGRIYNAPPSPGRSRIYHGVWGSELFQSIYQPKPSSLQSFLLTPEWYMVAGLLALLGALAGLWPPLLYALPLLAAGTLIPLSVALRGASRRAQRRHDLRGLKRLAFLLMLAFLHLLQPLARLRGRLGRGLRLWPRRRLRLAWPLPRTHCLWKESWTAPETSLRELEAALMERDAIVRRGGDFDRWDLEVRNGVIGSLRIHMAVEEHGQGKQLLRLRSRPRFSAVGLMLVGGFALLSGAAAFDGAWAASALLALLALAGFLRAFLEAAAAAGQWKHLLKDDPRRMS
ncbi:MAG TPA: glycosyltransferase [Acidobacteriota bacterium]|nr:glycosyltransferase [Acidobacteriota bacterium]